MKLYKSLNAAMKEPMIVKALKISIQDQKDFEVISNFPLLEELHLEANDIKFPSKVPWEKLRTLSIKVSNPTHPITPLFLLPKLENLKIIETPLKQLILPIGASLPNLKQLTIKNCGLEMLPEEISTFTQLNELSLPQNQLHTLPKSFQFLTHLKRLNLDQNLFTQFPDLLAKLPKLSHLSIDENQFIQEEKERIQREFNIWL
ncbi:MAG: leucine-rich repeat domain-containing protein [Bacteriovoracaceae bacterium]